MPLQQFLATRFEAIDSSERDRATQIWEAAQERFQREYNIALVETIVVWAIFVATVVGALVSFFVGERLWGAIFGGVSVVDLFGGAILWAPQKQLGAVSKRIMLLEIHLMTVLSALKACEQQDPNNLFECSKKAVDEFAADVRDL